MRAAKKAAAARAAAEKRREKAGQTIRDVEESEKIVRLAEQEADRDSKKGGTSWWMKLLPK
jgi:hypothetical protein